MKDHGVTPEYLADMKEILKDLTVAHVVRLRDHGITPGFVNHARSRGFKTTDPDELVRLKNGGLYKALSAAGLQPARRSSPNVDVPASDTSDARSAGNPLTARCLLRHVTRNAPTR